MFDSVGVAYKLCKQKAPTKLHDLLKLFSINTQLLPELNLMTLPAETAFYGNNSLLLFPANE